MLPIPYIGILGAKEKNTAEEIALSIIAEIKAAFAGKTGKMLREKRQPIHQNN